MATDEQDRSMKRSMNAADGNTPVTGPPSMRAGAPVTSGRARRDRRGRGLRGMLAPSGLPISHSRSDTFDAIVLSVVDHLQPTVGDKLSEVEFAVQDIPPVSHHGTGDFDFDADILDDNSVPLSRLYRSGLGELRGPVVVIYRRPVESRAVRPDDLSDLIHDVVVEQVARLLGSSPEEIDPPAG